MKSFKPKQLLFALATALLMIGSSGCIVQDSPDPCYGGYDGRDGRSFFSVDWSTDVPDYLSTNNTAIPPVFTYGDYYESAPGTFDLYYEGSFVEDCCPKEYFWDVTFDVWFNAGTVGGPCGQNGFDGADSYLTLITSPYGPYESRINKTIPSEVNGMKVISDTGKEIILEKTDGDLTMRITYKALDKSKKADLDQANVKVGQVKK